MKTRIALRVLLLLSLLTLVVMPASADVWLPSGLVEIESEAFMNAMWLSGSCNIPDGTTSIGSYAFYGCSGITSLTIPTSVNYIGSKAFAGCTGLTGSITIPEGTEVAEDAFENCPNLTVTREGEESDPSDLFRWSVSNKKVTITAYIGKKTVTSVTIPAEIDGMPVTAIDSYAFSSSRYLTSITLPDTVTTIGSHAFSYCTKLTKLHLPASVTSIGRYAFYYCSSLTGTLHVVDAEVPTNAFTGCKNLTVLQYETNDDGTLTISGSTGSQSTITVPLTVGGRTITAVGREAFAFRTSLQEINLPSSITSIGQSAFYYCSALRSISIPRNVRSIGPSAFYNCTALESVSLADNGMTIGSLAFYSCSNLTGVYSFVDSTINSSAFSSCPSVDVWCFTSTSDAEARLDACYTARTDVAVPSQVQGYTVNAMGPQAFYGCSSVQNITLPTAFTAICDEAFYKCTTLQSINIPYGVKSIGISAFQGCTALTSISIPATVDVIGGQAFYACTALASASISSTHTILSPYAFGSCSSLTSLSLPAGFRNVGNMSLTGTSWLRNKLATLAQAITEDCSSDYERALALHDWLVESTAYDTSYTYYGPEGVLYHGLGVCNAYTLTYGMMLNAVGIEYMTVTGTATDKSGNTGSHAWTLVNLDGCWYHVDTTWDDPIPDGRERHTYFCMTDAEIAQDHVWDTDDYPSATGTATAAVMTLSDEEDSGSTSTYSLTEEADEAEESEDEDQDHTRNKKDKKDKKNKKGN